MDILEKIDGYLNEKSARAIVDDLRDTIRAALEGATKAKPFDFATFHKNMKAAGVKSDANITQSLNILVGDGEIKKVQKGGKAAYYR